MKIHDIMNKKIAIAEKRILELTKSGDLKKLAGNLRHKIAKFYEEKSMNRLDTAHLIYSISKNADMKKANNITSGYADYSEAVAAAYYAMYYIIHSYLASEYKTKLREDVRGVHAITQHIILYYLVKTEKLAKHLYEEYLKTFETTLQVQKINVEDFQEEAFKYAEKYDQNRSARESFTYNISLNAQAYHAEQAIRTAEEFINAIKQLMVR